ncbi:tRNA synthetases class II (A)-domain-containing protein [Piptocephalis cylindrospora]|uniref:Alanine--tRNA ligase n=1 Tax=Piptocephalis cylindrospora TaxID=1907219 RepID=A0A4P9Y4D2_9FUNG|nr:tRNA synthetases class II (A)-domain-containing protein [Piptocephalis cylindrospora]|eukprot:RKP13838.1 tRNA synthetases class II (A)-domain-containing protein [Piptocephalis cylindrospora]
MSTNPPAPSSLSETKPFWSANKVRETFISYYVSKHNHTFFRSSPTVPVDDPTLLFANAGMNQYKPIFLGVVDPSSPLAALKRATNSQKCIRAGGKHNDLDDVGRDVYHHTFFEMLGNWSFGDYFKAEAIAWSWDLLTNVFGMDADRLYVTYYGGDEAAGLPADTEARDMWIATGVPASRVLPYGNEDNFWEMGETGPCGPCSEVHYDRIGGRDAADLVNADDPDVLEIWNIVFIQFNREADRSLRPLPAKHIDTGMGMERVVSILQGVRSNYDTDVFQPLFAIIQEKTGARPYTGLVGAEDVDGVDMAYRVVADHLRTLVFAMSDGGVPSNEGRGYVLRRILRRGARYVRRKFNTPIGTFFPSLVDTLVAQMGEAFPELTKRIDTVKRILQEEEESFARTLDRGERLFETYLARAKETGAKELRGEDVWRLYDTYGFPVDLTRLMAEEAGLGVNEEAFARSQEQAKEASRAGKGASGSGGAGTKGVGAVVLDVHRIAELDKIPGMCKTEDASKYEKEGIQGKILALYHPAEGFVSSVDGSTEESQAYGVLLDKTNFYAEQGGQEADRGVMRAEAGVEFVVENVQVYAGYVLHAGVLRQGQGTLRVGQVLTCEYDEARRASLRSNHTATHLLNYALRKVLKGDEVDQKGSLVAAEKLRFDFSHPAALTTQELRGVEEACEEFVQRDLPVYSAEVPLSVAKAIHGLRAVFGEVYPDPVRVVSVGFDVDEVQADVGNSRWASSSVEFCGGTHVGRTGDIGRFVLLEEAGIAKGIRRIVAVTGPEAKEADALANTFQGRLEALETLKGKPEMEAELKEVAKALDGLVISAWRKAGFREEYGRIRKTFTDGAKVAKAAQGKEAIERIKQAITEAESSKGYVVTEVLVGGNNKALVGAVAALKSHGKVPGFVYSLDTEGAGKILYQCYVPKALVTSQGVKANELTAIVAGFVGGRSGGKDEGAQGSGDKTDQVPEAVKAAEAYFAAKMTQ